MNWRLRRFGRAVARLFAYAPIIWRNEDWDWAYLFELMEFKIRRMQNVHEGDTIHLHHKRRARELQIAAHLLKRIRTDDYASKDYDEYLEKWGELTWKPLKDGLSMLDGRENVHSEQDAVNCRADFKRISARELTLSSQDEAMLFSLLRKRFRYWWT